MREETRQIIYDILTEHWCPDSLADEASRILSQHYPCPLIGATDEEIAVVRQAKEYVTGTDDE
jgi:hypothetical protein